MLCPGCADFIRDRLITLQRETGNNYNFEATPAEGTSYRMAKIDKSKYPDIVCANEEAFRRGAEPYYTNSSQLPVNYTDDIFEAMDLQDEIQSKYTGGTVFHIFAGEQVEEPEVIKTLVIKICHNYKMPYFTFSPTFSVCPSHGYLTGNRPCARSAERPPRSTPGWWGISGPLPSGTTGRKRSSRRGGPFRSERPEPLSGPSCGRPGQWI